MIGRSHAIRPGHHRLHRHRILGAEIEDLADLDAARVQPAIRRHFALERARVVDVFRGCIDMMVHGAITGAGRAS